MTVIVAVFVVTVVVVAVAVHVAVVVGRAISCGTNLLMCRDIYVGSGTSVCCC